MKRLVFLAVWIFAAAFPALAQAGPGRVEGTVKPLEWAQEVEVCLVEAHPSVTCTVPEADGSYVLANVPVGPVLVEFIPSYRSRLAPQYYKGKSFEAEATPIVISGEKATVEGIDADLVKAGAIKGTVTDAVSAAPLSEIEVCAVATAQPIAKSCEETDASGEYELHSLPPGKYKVGFWGHGNNTRFEAQYYLNKPSLAEGTPVTVTLGATTGGIDAAMTEGGRIEGAVLAAANGEPIVGTAVCLFAASEQWPQRCTYSEALGHYAFEGIASGPYQVGFSLEPSEVSEEPEGDGDEFQTQFFTGADSRAAAQTIALLAPAVVSGVDASLSRPPAENPPAPGVATPASIIPAVPFVSAPGSRPAKCKSGHRRKSRGTQRCGKRRRHRRHHHRKGKSSQRTAKARANGNSSPL